MNDPLAEELARLHEAAGWKSSRYWRLWARLEILLGLTATGVGLFLGIGYRTGSSLVENPAGLLASLLLFVLGGYLAMAGHRSHLYQSNNRLVAYLAAVIRSQHPSGDRS